MEKKNIRTFTYEELHPNYKEILQRRLPKFFFAEQSTQLDRRLLFKKLK